MESTIFIQGDYKSWIWENEIPPEILNNKVIDPFKYKLLNGDTIRTSKNENTVEIINSPIRQSLFIAGVLMLHGNKTYGKTPNKKRFYYRVIPQQVNLPSFFVPYEVDLKFHKHVKNKYVLFRFDYWNESELFPYGILTETLGDVTNLEAFYEFQLYSKSLNGSMKEMTKCANEMTKTKSIHEYFEEIRSTPSKYNIKDNCSIPDILTIDPVGGVDRDDALSVLETSDGYIVSVYLTNVYIWLEMLNLWKSFTSRIATIYLPTAFADQ